MNRRFSPFFGKSRESLFFSSSFLLKLLLFFFILRHKYDVLRTHASTLRSGRRRRTSPGCSATPRAFFYKDIQCGCPFFVKKSFTSGVYYKKLLEKVCTLSKKSLEKVYILSKSRLKKFVISYITPLKK